MIAGRVRRFLRDWLAETHGVRFELVRHFLPTFFDTELVATRGEWTRLVAGILALLVSSWMVLFFTMRFKYGELAAAGLAMRRAVESHNDLLSLTAMTLCATGLLVAALWQSIYPTLRDCLALAGLPVKPADLFVAKFTALSLVFAVFLLVFPLQLSIVLAAITEVTWFDAIYTLITAAGVIFFGLIALQGLLLNILPVRWFGHAVIWLQAMVVAMSIGGFWLALERGHILLANWTVGIREMLIAAAAALTGYMLSFHRHRRLLMESPRVVAHRSGLFFRALDWFVRDPREQAALAFFWMTVRRNPVHRLAVLVYLALAAAWVSEAAIRIVENRQAQPEMERLMFGVYPLMLVVFAIAGLRHIFALPAELRANWIFQITEREGRIAWMHAVERFVYGVGILPLVLAGAVLTGWYGGFLTGLAWGLVAFLFASIVFERLFRHWNKLPFTCSYMPGKRMLLMTLTTYAGSIPLLATVAWIAYLSASNPALFVIMLAVESALWRLMRRARVRTLGILPLRYVEQAETDVDRFQLSGDGMVFAQEQFAREWSDYLRADPEVPLIRPRERGETRLGRLWVWLQAAPQDLQYAVRTLRKSPGFVATVALTLGLGLGLNGAFFTVFNAILLRPLAVRDPASLVSVKLQTRQGTPVYLPSEVVETLAEDSPAFSEVATTRLAATGIDGRSSRIALVSGNFFSMLGVGASAGRVLRVDDQDRLVVLNSRLVKNRYGGDASIVGRKVNLNGAWFEVIGVAAPEFAGVAAGTVEMVPEKYARFGVGEPDAWVPVKVWNQLPGVQPGPELGVIGRLRPGVNEAEAEAMLLGPVRRLTADSQPHQRVRSVELDSMDVAVTWTTLSYSFPLLVAFCLTMLIPCANAANILLARASLRQRELGTRLSLGASRGRVVRQLLMEGLVLATLSALVGLVISRIALQVFLYWLTATAPTVMLQRFRMPDLHVDLHVWFYMAVLAGVTTVLFALAPAAQSTRISVAAALRGQFGSWQASNLRDALVVVQVALCVMLLAASGLLLRGMQRVTAIERGYDVSSVFAVGNESAEDAVALESILRSEPWVDTVAVLSRPVSEASKMDVTATDSKALASPYFLRGSGEYFQLLRIPMIRGRVFTREEGEFQHPVAVVSELTAHALWPGQDPIGRTFSIAPGTEGGIWRPRYPQATVVGVCRDIVVKAKDAGARATVYFPDKLRPGTIVAARGKGSAEQTRAAMNAAMLRAPGSAHGAWLVPMQEAVDWEVYPQLAVSWLATILGGVALLLTVSGIYGVMQYLVSQRTKEIGIRMALGATVGQVARFVLSHSGRLAGLGALCGMFLAVGTLQYVGSVVELFVSWWDVGAYALSLVVAGAAALFAVVGPTRRACRVDPQQALRAD